MKTKELKSVCILGLGLLGGSVGMAVERVFPKVRRRGYSHREVTRKGALNAGVVDEVFATAAEAALGSDLVVMATPIGIFDGLMSNIAPVVGPDCIVTDVGSTKSRVHGWARKHLRGKAAFVGSHPMAGSEQRGVDFARSDLFDGAACIVTSTGTGAAEAEAAEFLVDFWSELGMRVSRMTPTQHDRVLARISHLPHVLAAALVNVSDADEMLLCGKGFLDTTRIASGPESVWHDILMTNAANADAAIGKLIKELQRWQVALKDGDGKRCTALLGRARTKRNELVERKLQRKELPD